MAWPAACQAPARRQARLAALEQTTRIILFSKYALLFIYLFSVKKYDKIFYSIFQLRKRELSLQEKTNSKSIEFEEFYLEPWLFALESAIVRIAKDSSWILAIISSIS